MKRRSPKTKESKRRGHPLALGALMVFGLARFASGATPSSIKITPQGAVLQQGSSLQFSVRCTYKDGTSDDCTRAGGAEWRSSNPTAMTVSGSGKVTWTTDPGSENPFALGYVLVAVGEMRDRVAVMGQHVGDTFYQYPTPDYRSYNDPGNNSILLPLNVVVGATVTIGSGFVINHATPGEKSGNPFQMTCNWASSNSAIATVNRYGLVTAISPGNVTITCGRAGNAVYGVSNNKQWISPGNVITLDVVAGGSGTTTWYVRPGGGTPFVSRSETPKGQCDGKHDADYSGHGVNQPCALGDFEDLYFDQVSKAHDRWMIAGGDTVIVRQKSSGYNTAIINGYNADDPVNCGDMEYCDVPSVPSGTASQHTRILGGKYASCHADSAKTLLLIHGREAISVRDSQFVDIACFEITDHAGCGPGEFKHTCGPASSGGDYGVEESALTSEVNYSNLFIHGLESSGIFGATGVGVVADHVHIRAMPLSGIDMDDAPWNSPNISVAGGFTMTNSITEFTGCIEEYPVVHEYPYIECRDQNTGAYGDGFGTGSATGKWVFDHDIWRYNFQDGLDLIHSGIQSLTVTNSQSYGNDGQAYKIGSADIVIFRNNFALENCNRIAFTIGDEPASAIVPGVATCRANGDWIPLNFTDQGTYVVQNNTLVGYGTVPFDLACEKGWSDCSHANTIYQNNVMLGYSDPFYTGGDLPATFYKGSPSMPPHDGWAVRDHNLYYHVRHCPTPLSATEICNTRNPLFVSQPSSPIRAESDLDHFNFSPRPSSYLRGHGIAIAGIDRDMEGTARPNPPSIGAVETSGALSSSVAPQQPESTAPISSGFRRQSVYSWLSCVALVCGALLLYRSANK
ncbi:MAG: Ig-like domain-containing protein [Acidobacteriaceae bacterium]